MFDTPHLGADALRLLMALLWCGLAGQVAWFVVSYVTRPWRLRVGLVGLLYLLLAGEALFHHFMRIGMPADPLLLVNLALFVVSNLGWVSMAHHHPRRPGSQEPTP